MAKKRKRKKDKRPLFDDISHQTKQAIGAVGFVVLGVFFVLSSLGMAGRVGGGTHGALEFLFGYGFVLAPIVCALYVYVLLKPRDDEHVSMSKAIGVALLFLSLLGLFALFGETGGIIGLGISYSLEWMMGFWISAVALFAITLVGAFLFFNIGFNIFGKSKDEEEFDEGEEELEELEPEDGEEVEEGEEEPEEEEEEEDTDKKTVGERLGFSKKGGDGFAVTFSGPYEPPPLSLLKKDGGKPKAGDIKANSNLIKRTLKNFNIDVEMDEVKVGPTVTQYALKPAEGVRLSKITGLQSNLELALEGSMIRIEAPIPGKSLLGIEVPNTQKQKIGLASLLSSPEFTDSPKPLLVALGKDITGGGHFADISGMPHALIAGTTNSGKSVLIHNLVTSLLFRNSPEQLRFIMADPKRVELTLYDGIPHLLVPVITDAKKVLVALKWAIKEMERRYDILQENKVRDISSYHEEIYDPAKEEWVENGSMEEEKDELPDALPYIVIMIDELSDLMSAYPRELEALIVRLTQKSRAVGIHLIIATQRPEVKVITGLIKANMPCRLALRVNSLTDSRVILDSSGAEKLLGYGDMLALMPDRNKPYRLQSAYVTPEEIKKVVSYLKNQTDAQELDAFDLDGKGQEGAADAFFGSSIDDEDEDDLYEDAKETVISAGRASTSFLQRKLRVGYSRAARLIDMLEERGVIGPGEGAKPREILGGGSDDEHEEDEDERV